MSLTKFNGTLINQFDTKIHGNAAVGKKVGVYIAGTAAKATLTDREGNPLANPVTTGVRGDYGFWIESGFYDLVLNEGEKDKNGNDISQKVQFQPIYPIGADTAVLITIPAFAGSEFTLVEDATGVVLYLNGRLLNPDEYDYDPATKKVTLNLAVTLSDEIIVMINSGDIGVTGAGSSYYFKTISEAAAKTGFKVGDTVITGGYYQEGDGGNGRYIVRASAGPIIGDGFKNHVAADGVILELLTKPGEIYAAQYGVNELNADNSPALQFTLNDAKPAVYGGKIKKIWLPEGYLNVSTKMTSEQLHMEGMGWSATWIQYNNDITVFEIKGSITVKNLSVINTAGKGNERGICFGSERNNDPSNTMSYCVFESVFCWYADISWWIRASTHCNWLNCTSYSLVGLRFARNADPYDAETPNIAGWNTISPELGWFHNMNHIINFIGNDVECGIWGSLMGTVIHATCQGQKQNKLLNKILPTWADPTGMYLEGGASVSPGWGNTITYFYTEETTVPLRCTYISNVVIENMFVQGWTYEDRYPAVIIADNSDITINKMTGQGYFDKKCILTNNSRVVGPIAGAVLGEFEDTYSRDGTSEWWVTGINEQYMARRQFSFVGSGTPGDTAIAVISGVDFTKNRQHYRVTVTGIYNSAVTYVATWDMFYWNNAATPVTSELGYANNGVSANVPTVSVGWSLGGVPFVEVSSEYPNAFEIFLERVTEQRTSVTVVS